MMKKSIFILSLMILLAGCEKELNPFFEEEDTTEKVKQVPKIDTVSKVDNRLKLKFVYGYVATFRSKGGWLRATNMSRHSITITDVTINGKTNVQVKKWAYPRGPDTGVSGDPQSRKLPVTLGIGESFHFMFKWGEGGSIGVFAEVKTKDGGIFKIDKGTKNNEN